MEKHSSFLGDGSVFVGLGLITGLILTAVLDNFLIGFSSGIVGGYLVRKAYLKSTGQ